MTTNDKAAERPRPPTRKPFWTIDKVKPEYIETSGNASETARRLAKKYGRKCARQTIWRLVQEHPEITKLAEEIIEAHLDIAEAGILSGVRAGDRDAIRFLLVTKGKDRGWSRRTELTGADGRPLQVQNVSNDTYTPKFLASLSDEELNMLIRIEQKKHEQQRASEQPAARVGEAVRAGEGSGGEG